MITKKQTFRPLLSTLLIFAFLLGGCRPSQPVVAGDLQSLTSTLDSNIPTWLNQFQTPGASVALVVDGKLAWAQGYGLSDREKKSPTRPDTVYQIASISKPVTAWGVMHLVEQGKIDLDAPVQQYLTRWKLPLSPYDSEGVTVRRLLSHSAGLSVHGYPGTPPDQTLPSLEDSLSGAGGEAYAVKQVSEPGKQYSYSGGSYTLLQLLIEEVTGQSFSEYMQSAVLDPLGMSHSSFEWRPDLQPMTAAAYDRQEHPLPNYLFTEKAAAGLYTTASELALFGAAALPGPDGEAPGREVLTPSGVEALFTPTIAMPQKSVETFLSGMDAYGLGYFIETLPDGSHWYSHNGGNKGWRSLLIIAPKQRAVLVVLTNSDNGDAVSDEITTQWAGWLGSGLPKRMQNMNTLSTTLIVILTLSLLGFFLWLYRFTRQIADGKRRFALPIQWTRGLRLLVALLLAALWLWGGNELIDLFFPKLVEWTAGVVLLWTFAIALNALSITPPSLSFRK
jgi:CubicO group peptidase (beta-lactamase class C family)